MSVHSSVCLMVSHSIVMCVVPDTVYWCSLHTLFLLKVCESQCIVFDWFKLFNMVSLIQRDWECVMCMSEECSVVFLPCAHQIVCVKCNELHQKQGMTDCPSCRTTIQERIHVMGWEALCMDKYILLIFL